jgi:hypothetical protein
MNAFMRPIIADKLRLHSRPTDITSPPCKVGTVVVRRPVATVSRPVDMVLLKVRKVRKVPAAMALRKVRLRVRPEVMVNRRKVMGRRKVRRSKVGDSNNRRR